ncbi:putative potassium transport system protein kup [Streptococcus parauberis]|uniref:Probable potassium transport system protein Kup n=1 Tax=Streptococcus parauberis KRS-02083 TaxID=1207545 RepID=A0ABP2SYI6_9STRE|nr:KUP/HAK/KT family potassium transporter [Streptococcus parauberis]AUT06484.1 putative potassium transport system protein kup [Streptococcus parauberis]EMG25505.1 Kup system potassium uptake protein [Streptococcus parauberis KRS-02083]UWV09864.1 KUP/HAK/KT family potassium transporter [Streptococcus parauberis]WEM61824.1 KUP/HAK/KT family potassium transporter [Streptococcus parauberis]WEM64553.1 KUP/HAK/KT family potassium transporter [Streptococcus parauberis]
MSNANHAAFDKASKAGFIIALGIVYGDIGTSPLYTMQSLVENQGGLSSVSEIFILGSISLIFWTLTLITTIKYVWIALKADNHHEGGIFSLYTLVRKMSPWLIVPAMIGGATLLSDGALTPAVTVTSAIEGLKAVPGISSIYQNQTNVIITTLLIILSLFSIQRFGTSLIGKLFGPVMLVWFSFLGLTGLYNALGNLEVFKAINPYYAIHLLLSPENHRGIFILGSIFLATTGAEALYSDLGHVGRGNVYFSWPFVKICIVLSYCGQGAWILANRNSGIELNPFFAAVPESFRVFAVLIATAAAIIASQALITGSFTLVAEAMRLKIFPLFRVTYPGQNLGQLYIPVINWLLCFITSCVVLYFKNSANMEAAYGLAITITMLMTTVLLNYYLIKEGMNSVIAHVIMSFFALIEFIFFAASAVKFMHGGYVVVILALGIVSVMFIWHKGTKIVFKYVKSLNLLDYRDQIKALRDDKAIDLYQTNVVYLTNRLQDNMIDKSILYSILDKRPKRAKVYWFVNVKVTDEPYTAKYKVDMMGTDYMVKVELFLGFRMPQSVPRYLRTIVQDLMESGRLPQQVQEYSITPGRKVGDFRFVIIEERVSNARQLNGFERFIMQTKASIKHFTATPARWFGLQYSEFKVEVVPLILSDILKLPIKEFQTPKEIK